MSMIGISRCGESPEPGERRGERRLLLAGDILLSRGVERQLTSNPQSLSRALYAALSKADWLVGNLEGAVGSPDDCLEGPPQGPCFPIRDELIPLLGKSGFKAIGIANNHSYDLGRRGYEATRRALIRNDLMALTYEDAPQFIRLDDTTVSLVSCSLIPNRENHSVDVPSLDLRQKLRVARNLSNLVVVYVHWGSEFLDWPDKKQRQTAEWLMQNGADIIAGHHPHTIQKPECLHSKPVFYSLGNLLFDQKYPSTKEGMLADCHISLQTVRCTAMLTKTPAGSTFPCIGGVDENAEKVLSGCAVTLRPPLEVNGVTLRPENHEGSNHSSGLLLAGVREGKTLWKTRQAKIVSIEPMRVDGPQTAEYLFTLERHFSTMDGEEGLRPCVYEVRPEGLIPKWRGTALAWPLVDATFLPGNGGILCALHRGDSFIALEPGSHEKRIAAYHWNGFGFSGIRDPEVIGCCRDRFEW